MIFNILHFSKNKSSVAMFQATDKTICHSFIYSNIQILHNNILTHNT